MSERVEKINQAIEVLGKLEKLEIDKVLRKFQEKLLELQTKARGAVFVLLSDLNRRIEEARESLVKLDGGVDAQVTSDPFIDRVLVWRNRWNDWLSSARRKAEVCNLGGAIEDLMVAERIFQLDRPGVSGGVELALLGEAFDIWLRESREAVQKVVSTFTEQCRQ